MNHLIIGDIHGCYYTFCNMLTYWRPDREQLVLVGDLIDRGNYSSLVVQKCMELDADRSNMVIVKGNHEAEFMEHVKTGYNRNWMVQCGEKTLADFAAHRMDVHEITHWMKKMPLILETEGCIVTHAGISETIIPLDENNNDGVLWNRKPLKNMGKVQVHGHTPLKRREPAYDSRSNSWNIDTGAGYGYGLTGLRLDEAGNVIGQVFVETDQRDIL